MAVIKAVSSKAGIGQAIDYVEKEEKTEEKLVSGIGCTPNTVKDEMQVTKLLWGKTGGRTYKHYIQSFAPGEKIDLVQAHDIAKQLAENVPAWKGHEVLIATHKDTEHIHTHFIVNSVNYEDGHKLQWSKKDLQNMKDFSDQLCKNNGLSITQKGKTFEGEDREEISAYTKETYQLLKKAEREEVKSYVQDIAAAILECKDEATSREDFIKKMNERGYGVDWQDNHKCITFTDLTRQSKGEKQCKVRNNKLEKYYNMDFGKESLQNEFEINIRRKEETERAKHQLDRAAVTDDRGTVGAEQEIEPGERGTVTDDRGTVTDDRGTVGAEQGIDPDGRAIEDGEIGAIQYDPDIESRSKQPKFSTEGYGADPSRFSTTPKGKEKDLC